jgi:two-component system chemotaxis response regulator CheB
MIKVMVVDDSAVVRQTVGALVKGQPDMTLVAAAPDPVFAIERMRNDWPDVIVLDVEMPRMDGLTFLRKIMSERPTPVIICSSLTQHGAETTVEALAAGAFHVIAKPTLGLRDFLNDASADLISTIRAAAQAKVKRLPRSGAAPTVRFNADVMLSAETGGALKVTTERIVAIGTSTGGTQALEDVLTRLSRTTPGIAVVQHMPAMFTAQFAERLNKLCQISVAEAKNGDRLLAGHALIAPGGKHMLVKRSGAQYHVEVKEGPPVNRHCPSVDVLFRSVAQAAGRNATGVIMTGMGDDGARGLLEMLNAGARTLAQNEETCVVFGMPREAIRMGAAQQVVALEQIPALIANG